MPRRQFRIALAIVVGSVVVLVGVGAFVVKKALSYPDEPHAGKGVEVEVEIAPGMSFPKIAELLEDEGIIDNPRWFRLYAMHRGVTTKVRSGDYVLRDDSSPREVLDELLEGVRDVTVSVTVPEGRNMLEVFELVEEAGVAEAEALEALARDPEFLEEHGIDAPTIEGHLFPETYRFRAPSPPGAVLTTMLEQYRIVWARVRERHERSLERLRKKLGWSDYEFLIMASIVEKEAVNDEERPRIAQVFYNRLQSPRFSKLETDPTIRYGCIVPLERSAACERWDLSDRLHRAQLDDVDNPYNTYQHPGLPPGPIGNPGEASLEATLNPDGSRYFYFVARGDGSHVFSRTLAEHERAVDRFQR